MSKRAMAEKEMLSSPSPALAGEGWGGGVAA
jgi:hypothetical protein